MKPWILSIAFAAGVLCGCMTAGPPAPASTSSAPPAVTGSSATPTDRATGDPVGMPLLVDRSDMRLGTTVQFGHIPSVVELHDATILPGLAHVVLSLSAWPSEDAPIQVLNQIPEGADLVIVLAGYPPTRAAAEMWRYVSLPFRLIVIVPGPPLSRDMITDLNTMPQLERVIAQMDQPSRSGFERLQRPLSFRMVIP